MDNPQVDHKQHERRANHFLAHSYSLYFLLLLIGVFLDLVIHVWVFQSQFMQPIGFTLIALATFLIVWAESTHHHRLQPGAVKGKEAFYKGPYCYTRHPTHWGLFLLLLGLGVLLNAFFVILAIIISFVISKLTFLKKHDISMVEKHGEHYEEYKKSIKF